MKKFNRIFLIHLIFEIQLKSSSELVNHDLTGNEKDTWRYCDTEKLKSRENCFQW